MEWILAVSLLAAWIAVAAAVRAQHGAQRAEAAARDRQARRVELGTLIESGQNLLAHLPAWERPNLPEHSAWNVIRSFEASAEAAVEDADPTQLPRWRAPLSADASPDEVLRERLDRLQRIQDHL